MTHLGLFEGIGGFSYAAQLMGWETKAWCEWNTWCQQVLRYHFPEAEGFGDITKTDFTKYNGKIDIITGGFPCQPYSLAGARKGKDDERHLWPEMLRTIREVQPPWVVGENVSGLVNWNGGLVFDEVQTDFETEGYEILPFLLPAAGVGAPHKRERIWFIAYSESIGSGRLRNQSSKERSYYGHELPRECGGISGTKQDAADTRRPELQRSIINRGARSARKAETEGGQSGGPIRCPWENFPTQSPICGPNDGIPHRLDGLTISKWRTESIKAYGNAVVPQVPLQIFKAIEQFNTIIENEK